MLIHEATLQDGMEADALAKKHTTTGQAIQVGQKCGAWRTILTHFSPRYQKIAEVTDLHLQAKALIAFDHLRVSCSQLEWAYAMVSVYRKLIRNDEESVINADGIVAQQEEVKEPLQEKKAKGKKKE